MGTGSTAELVVRRDDRDFEVQLALGGFLAGYSGNTRLAYQQDLRLYVGWCHRQQVQLFDVRRTHIELFARWLEHHDAAGTTIARRLSTVAGFTGTASTRNSSATTQQPTCAAHAPSRGNHPGFGSQRTRGLPRRSRAVWCSGSCPGMSARPQRTPRLRGPWHQHRRCRPRTRTPHPAGKAQRRQDRHRPHGATHRPHPVSRHRGTYRRTHLP